jgi:hypothetical protein
MSGPSSHRTRRSGQALLELVITLVAVMVLVAALLQIGQLTGAHLIGLHEARSRADALALSDVYLQALPNPDYLRDWSPGPDGVAQSRDDQALLDNDQLFVSEIVQPLRPGDLNRYLPGNRFAPLGTPGLVIREFDLLRGDATTRTVPLLPAARHLLYDAESIAIGADCWMIWSRNIP